uniref:Transmembrane domain-containing protein n=1 Tax=Spironucleus salmonicida TaxID=348837 RepID=V6LSH8_9EUKA|eukprot:EST47560.1 Transmembrane domain-containing protein [Spironucleus salmonicida]
MIWNQVSNQAILIANIYKLYPVCKLDFVIIPFTAYAKLIITLYIHIARFLLIQKLIQLLVFIDMTVAIRSYIRTVIKYSIFYAQFVHFILSYYIIRNIATRQSLKYIIARISAKFLQKLQNKNINWYFINSKYV